jgi:hypothetical protein
MSDFIPKAPAGGVKVGGLGPKAQKLQALREKAAGLKSGGKAGANASAGNVKGAAGFKKTAFQRKAT